jgi:hypothetical protein
VIACPLALYPPATFITAQNGRFVTLPRNSLRKVTGANAKQAEAGGPASQLRTSLCTEFPANRGKNREFRENCGRWAYIPIEFCRLFTSLTAEFPGQHNREFSNSIREISGVISDS